MDLAPSGKGDQRYFARVTRLEAHRRPRGNIEPEAPRGSAVARLFDSLLARQPASIGNLVARPLPEGWSFSRAPARRG